MLSIREAIDTIMPRFEPLSPEPVQLLAALGRVLSGDVIARLDLPEHDNSAMDGYAVRAAELAAANTTLPVQGEARAGGELQGALLPAHAMRIFTGAPLPEGADTVVMQEDTSREADRVTFRIKPNPGAHVRRRGSDVRTGARLLASGTVLAPGEIGILAAQDIGEVLVHRRPRVAILCTGDELREVGAPQRPGSIINSNAYALHAAVVQCGAEPWVLPTAHDQLDDITARVREGLTADVLLTVGGVSVGDYDFVSEALGEAGVDTTFHKVAIKPGKPILFGSRGRVPVLGLPGNPVSALVTFEVFVRPALLRMSGHRDMFALPVAVELDTSYEHGAGRTELARAKLHAQDGRLVAKFHARQGSGSLPSMTGVDALVILPKGKGNFEAGACVNAIRLGDAPRTSTPPIDDRSP